MLSSKVKLSVLFRKKTYCQQLECHPLYAAILCPMGVLDPVLVLLSVGFKMYCSHMYMA